MADFDNMTKWQGQQRRLRSAAVLAAWVLAAMLAAVLASACASTTEEHISATSDAITFSRMVGRKAATGGFVLSKDSLVMRETK